MIYFQKESDLQDRIKIANSIIQSLDNKLRELSELTQDQLPQMLSRLRDMNAGIIHGMLSCPCRRNFYMSLKEAI